MTARRMTPGRVAREYGVEVLRPPHNLGSKAKAQNYALPYCATDLVLPVDADTILAADYVERIKRPFEDPRVVIAAGNVQTKVTRTVTERGRSIEYLYGIVTGHLISVTQRVSAVGGVASAAGRRPS